MAAAGAVLARVLRGTWRVDGVSVSPDPSDVAVVEGQLLASGTAGMVWWHLRSDPAFAQSPVGGRLNEAFKLNAVYAAAHETHVRTALSILRQEGLDPILFKGWDCARHYPHPAMRPYGDIDICLPAADKARATEALDGTAVATFIDLKHEEIDEDMIPGLSQRSELVELDGSDVRVLCSEDRLRILALHALKGEAWSVKSMCDVALVVESRPEDFDWELCLTDDPVVRDWVLTAIALAGKLLGADVDGAPAKAPPMWLVRRTLRIWSAPWPADHGVELSPLPSARQPLAFLRGLRARWPGPVQATISARARFSAAPRLPLQIADVIRRAADHLSGR